MKKLLETDIKEAYNQKAKERNDSPTQAWKIEERDRFIETMREEKRRTILELGAGPGKDSSFFKEQGFQPLATDISPAMVELCKQKGLDAAIVNIRDLSFPASSFDAVWALNCLLHIPKNDMEAVLTSIQHVLKPKGLFYLGVYGGWNHEGVWEEDSYRPQRFFSFYTEETLRQAVERYFIIEHFRVVPRETVGGDLPFYSLILRNKLKVKKQKLKK